ncbi:MAG TPA: AarF/ABC1/UbiB kinase family protein [Solirubrobacteraceae bacterium]|nr:AarF/ABC1/UbiB kinase family protein [Solirubrobacteraceae bacterium]
MAGSPPDPPPEAGAPPAGRLGRTARVGSLVTGQSLRWAGMRTANRLRTPERAQEARNERTAALVDELVEQLGRMRGAAMKLGQMISMAELDGLPDDQRQVLQAKLAALRDDVPPMPFSEVERVVRADLGVPLRQAFSEFDERAVAAASIGQVHRAVTRAGDVVAVKVQYPRVAEAVETDLRNAMLLVPLLRRVAPGLDARALFAELRERVSEELDYELEAQHQRRIERLVRAHPFISVPRVDTALSTRRVLVTEYVEGLRFDAVSDLDEPVRDRYGEIVFRFFFGLLYRDRIALGDPHPGNYLLRSDGRVAFLDFGLLRDVSAERVGAERALARAARDRDAAGLMAALTAAGYLPADRAQDSDPELVLRMVRRASRWYAVPGRHRFGGGQPGRDRHREAGDEERSARAREQVHRFTMPADAVLIRRMHGIVAVVLGRLRAAADWGAIAAEYLHGAAPATDLGESEAIFLAARGRS